MDDFTWPQLIAFVAFLAFCAFVCWLSREK